MQDLFESEKSNSTQAQHRARQLVILCDGTSNTVQGQGGTNVLKLLSALPADDALQKVFYDTGVGSPAYAPGATWLDQLKLTWERIQGLAFGTGVFENIAQAYEFLMREYQSGDQIFVFGFSRGAFTARSVVGMVNAFGLLPINSAHLIPTLLNIYFTRTAADPVSRMGRKLMSMEEPVNSRKALVRKVQDELIPFERQHVQVHFVGVWDTVATMGIPPLDKQIPVNASMKNVTKDAQGQAEITPKKFLHVRQALALDEHRALFAPRVYTDHDIDPPDASGQSLKQRWFAGSHCDVGGTYGDNSAISHAALMWIAQEAQSLQLRVHLDHLGISPSAPPRALIHSEIFETPWWAAAGMRVREAAHPPAQMAQADAQIIALNTTQTPLQYPQDSVWKNRQPKRYLLLASSAVLLLYCGYVLALNGFQSSADFTLWQLKALIDPQGAERFVASAQVKTALLFDTLMIAAYSYVLGRWTGRAFASIAGLSNLGQAKRTALNVLGMSLTALVLGDVAENTLTLIFLSWSAESWAWLIYLNRILLSLAAAIKYLGLLGCGVLMAWAIARWLSRWLLRR
jgi:uncharacterized protein (DUF2235 family)